MEQRSLEELFRTAAAYHQAGDLQQAEQLYRQILAANQRFAPAWHHLGVLAHQAGRSDLAIQMISQSISLGMSGEAHNNLGEAYRVANRFEEAIASYQRAIQQNPHNAEAYSNLGLTLNTQGKFAEAMPYLEKAISIKPNLANARLNFGIALDNLNRIDDAIEQWEITLRLHPDHPLAMNNLGVALQRRDRLERATATLRKLVEKYPTYAEGHANYALALAAGKRFDEALVAAKRAIDLEPNRAEAHNTHAVVLLRAERFDEALKAAEAAVALNPNLHQAIGNIGGIHQRLEDHGEAARWFERAYALKPGDPETTNALYGAYYRQLRPDLSLAATDRALAIHPHQADLHGNRSLALLAMGRYEEGFAEYEWRWRCTNFTSPPRDFERPLWQGSDIKGRTLLVHAEQGFGDIIQFARYIPMLADLGAKALVEVPIAVKSLIETLPGAARVVPKGLKLPDFDLHIPLMSLPRAFKTTFNTVPNRVPYFQIDPARIDRWRPALEQAAGNFKIGLVWGGNQKPDPKRSVPLASLAGLSRIANVSWFSLQTGEPRAELNDAGWEGNLPDLGKDLKDFADTAALMSMMDLVLTIDTASAHLAGAIGAKTWTMIPYAPDWRWGMHGEHCAWYPTMRLLRQPVRNDWNAVIARLQEELPKLIST